MKIEHCSIFESIELRHLLQKKCPLVQNVQSMCSVCVVDYDQKVVSQYLKLVDYIKHCLSGGD